MGNETVKLTRRTSCEYRIAKPRWHGSRFRDSVSVRAKWERIGGKGPLPVLPHVPPDACQSFAAAPVNRLLLGEYAGVDFGVRA